MNPLAVNASIQRSLEAGLMEAIDPGDGGRIRIDLKGISFCVLEATAGASTRVMPDPDFYSIDQELMVVATGITGGNGITLQGLQGTSPTFQFTENGTAIFRVTLEDTTKIWLRIGPGVESALPPDGDYGDITVSGAGTVWTIDAGVVTYAKIQDVSATDRVLGRVSAGPGDIEEIVFNDPIQAIADDASFADIRTTLGLGTMATQNSNNVSITGGSITGLSTLSTNTSDQGGSFNATYSAFSATTNVIGVTTSVVRAGGAGNVTNEFGFQALISNSEFTGLVTNVYGSYVELLANAGTITNTYGYYVGDITSGTQTNQAYSFYASDANSRNYFAGVVGIGIDAPPNKLSVLGDIASYNTFTSAVDYERLRIFWTGNFGTIATEAAGTGTLRSLVISAGENLYFQNNGNSRWWIPQGSGDFLAFIDNTYDIGTTVSFRPRDIHVARNIIFADDIRQTFNPGTNNAGINVGSLAGDPSSPSNGDLWYDSTANELTARINGANVALGAGGGTVFKVNQFRLGTTSGDPTADGTAASTIYLSPFEGNQIALYDGAAWDLIESAEVSLALSSLTTSKNYDVFAYDNAGTLTLELSAAWTNDTTRADAITRQDGVWVKSGTPTRRLVGTIRTSGTSTTENSLTQRFVWNAYNRVQRSMAVFDTTDSWTYTSTTIRQANGSAANQLAYVDGLGMNAVAAQVSVLAANDSGQTLTAGIGVDSTTVMSGNPGHNWNTGPIGVVGLYNGNPGLGYHVLTWLERSSAGGTTTWYGDAGASHIRSGITGTLFN